MGLLLLCSFSWALASAPQAVSSPDLSLQGLLFKEAAIAVYSKLISVFPAAISAVFNDLTVAVLGLMSNLRAVYLKVEVQGQAVPGVAGGDSGYDSQGDEMGLRSLVPLLHVLPVSAVLRVLCCPSPLPMQALLLVDFVDPLCGVSSKKMVKLVRGAVGVLCLCVWWPRCEHPPASAQVEAALPSLIDCCLDYALLTESQLEGWEDDPGRYIEEGAVSLVHEQWHSGSAGAPCALLWALMSMSVWVPYVWAEEDDVGDAMIRSTVGLTVVDVLECFPVRGLNALAATVRNRIASAAETHGKDAWKVCEAAILCVGLVLSRDHPSARSWLLYAMFGLQHGRASVQPHHFCV